MLMAVVGSCRLVFWPYLCNQPCTFIFYISGNCPKGETCTKPAFVPFEGGSVTLKDVAVKVRKTICFIHTVCFINVPLTMAYRPIFLSRHLSLSCLKERFMRKQRRSATIVKKRFAPHLLILGVCCTTPSAFCDSSLSISIDFYILDIFKINGKLKTSLFCLRQPK